MGRAVAKENPDHLSSTVNDLAEKWNLQAVYDLMFQELGTNSGLLGEVCRYLLGSPGKGIRPLLVLITSALSQLDRKSGVRLAAALETLHLSTLVHDDVLDASMLRRGIPSINSRWDNNTAILTGDFLFGKSLEMVQGFGDEVSRRFARIIIEIATGEFQQAERLFDVTLGIKEYKEIISKKTAIFISNCCAMAAIASGTSPDVVFYLDRFGFYTGMAFQIQDDISDWCQEEERMGKPVTHDLQQGVLTLPFLFALELSQNKRDMENIVASQNISKEDLDFIVGEIHKTGSLELALNTAVFYGQQAEKCLAYLPKTNHRKDLEKLLRNISTKTPQKTH